MKKELDKAKYTTWQVTWWSLKFGFKSAPGLFVLYGVLSLVSGLIILLQFSSLADVINNIMLDPTNKSVIYHSVLKLLFYLLLPQLVAIIKNYIDILLRFGMIRDLTIYETQKQSTLDLATIESSEYQSLLRRAQEWGVFQFYRVLYNQFANLENLSSVIFAAFILFKIDPRLVGLAIIASIPTLYVQIKYGREIWGIWQMNSDDRRKFFKLRGYFEQSITLIETKLWNIGGKYLNSIKELLKSFDEEVAKVEGNRTCAKIIALLVTIAASGIALMLVVNLTVRGTILIGTFTFAFGAFRQFAGSIDSSVNIITNQIEGARYASYWLEIFSLKPIIDSNPHGKKPAWQKPPKIEFKNVSFSYPETETKVLDNINLVIEPGEKVAIVGLNGAGKTTLIRLLARVFDPTKGEILLDGIPLKEISLDHWHSILALLFQDYGQYNFTARDIIALARGEHNENFDDIQKAALAGESKEFIEELPKKFETLIWKGFKDGVELSKGQNQRMALSRVFYRDSLITVLDEPTAAVDALSEEKIFDRLEELPDNRTVILISHRYSTVKNADKILVMQHGKIIESGTHSELMKMKGNYEMLYTKQAAGYQEELPEKE